jgi:hypothetical protein
MKGRGRQTAGVGSPGAFTMTLYETAPRSIPSVVSASEEGYYVNRAVGYMGQKAASNNFVLIICDKKP